MPAEGFEEVEVTVPADLGGTGGRMLLRHRGRDLQLELPAGYGAGEVVRVEVPIPQALEAEDSDSGESGLGIGMAASGAGPAGGAVDAGGAAAAAADPEASDGEEGLGSLSDGSSGGGYELNLEVMVAHAAHAAARMQRIYRGRVARRQVERAAMANLFPSERPVAVNFDARGEMPTTARTFVADVGGGGRGLMIALTDPALVQRLTVDVTGGPRPVFRTVHPPFNFLPAEGQRAIHLHAEAAPSRPHSNPHSQPHTPAIAGDAEAPAQSAALEKSIQTNAGQPVGMDLHFQEQSQTPGEQHVISDIPLSEAAEKQAQQHVGTELSPDSRPHQVGGAQAGEPLKLVASWAPPIGEGAAPSPSAAAAPSLGAGAAQPTSAGAAPSIDAIATPPANDDSVRDFKVHIHFLPFFQRPPLLISRRIHFSHHSSHLSEPCQHHTTLRDPDAPPRYHNDNPPPPFGHSLADGVGAATRHGPASPWYYNAMPPAPFGDSPAGGMIATAVEIRCAVRMQRKWRWYQAGSRRGLLLPREERSRRASAAVLVQSVVRGRRAALRVRRLQRERNEAGVAAWAVLRPLPLRNDFALPAPAPRPAACGSASGAMRGAMCGSACGSASGVGCAAIEGVRGAAEGACGACGWVGSVGSVSSAAAASELMESGAEASARLKHQHQQPSRHAAPRSRPAAVGSNDRQQVGGGDRQVVGGGDRQEARGAASHQPASAEATTEEDGDGEDRSGARVAVAVAGARLKERRRLVSLSRSFRALLARRTAVGARKEKVDGGSAHAYCTAVGASAAGDAFGGVRSGGGGGGSEYVPSAGDEVAAPAVGREAAAGVRREPPPARGRTRTRRVVGQSAVDTGGEGGEGSCGNSILALACGPGAASEQRNCRADGGGAGRAVAAVPRGEQLGPADRWASAKVIQLRHRERARAAEAAVKAEAVAARDRTASTLQGGWRGRAGRRMAADVRLLRSAARLTAASECAEAVRGLPAGRAVAALSSLASSAADAKQRAMRAEDFDRAKRCKALADGLAGVTAELRRAEAERARAAAAQQYELAICQRETIDKLKMKAARLLAQGETEGGRVTGRAETPRLGTAGSFSVGSSDAIGACSLRDQLGGCVPSLATGTGGGESALQSIELASPRRARFDRLVVQTDLCGRSVAVSAGASPRVAPGGVMRRVQSSPYCHSAPTEAWPQAPSGETGEPPQVPRAMAMPTPAQSAAATPLGMAFMAQPSLLLPSSSAASQLSRGPSTPRVPAKATPRAAAAEAAHTILTTQAAVAADLAAAASDEALLSRLSLTPADRRTLEPIISTFGELSALQLVSGRPALIQAALLRASSQLGSPAVLAKRGEAVAALAQLLGHCVASPHPDVVSSALRLLRLSLNSTLARANASQTARAVRELVTPMVRRVTAPSLLPGDDGLMFDDGARAVAAALGWVAALPQVGGARVCAPLLSPPPEQDGADEVVEMRLSLLLEAIRSVGASADAAPHTPAAPPPVPLDAAAAYICAAYRSRPRLRTHIATVARQLHASTRSRADAASLAAALRHGAPELHELCFGSLVRPPPAVAGPSEAEACAALQQRIARARTRTEAVRVRLLAMRAATQRHADERARAARHALDEAEGVSPMVLAMRAKLEAARRARDAIEEKARLLRRQSARVRPDDLGRIEKAKILNAQAAEQEQRKGRPAAQAGRRAADKERQAQAAAAAAVLRKRQQELLGEVEAAKLETEAARAEAGQLQRELLSG